MNLTTEFKENVRKAILEDRKNFGGSDAAYAKTLGIPAPSFSRLKNGELEQILSNNNWLLIGKKLSVTLKKVNWLPARTQVYTEIEDNLHECQRQNTSMILVDDCGIGKTYCARHIVSQMKNAFYFDCSQAKTRIQFVTSLARTLGVDDRGKHQDVKENIKYALNILEDPLIVLDEAGDLDYATLLVVKELWNASEGRAAWYMMGADGLKAKIQKGIRNHKVGFAELFSRFSEKFITLTPIDQESKRRFYTRLIGDVATVNAPGSNVNSLINKCYDKIENRHRSLRHLKTLINLKKSQ